MGIRMERLPSEMPLAALTDRCAQEMSKYRRKEPSDDKYCLEILRRAVFLGDEDAWAVLRQQFTSNIRLWIRRHPGHETALRYNSEENYISDSFTRFWRTIQKHHQTFPSVASMLSYLQSCTRSTITDGLRAYARPNIEPLPDYGHPDEPLFEDDYHADDVWEAIRSLLTNEKEILVARLHFFCNLKPRQIISFYPGHFSGEDEIYRLKRNIVEKVTRNVDKIRWRLGDSERS